MTSRRLSDDRANIEDMTSLPACEKWGTITPARVGYRVAVHAKDGTRRDAWSLTLQGAARKLVALTR